MAEKRMKCECGICDNLFHVEVYNGTIVLGITDDTGVPTSVEASPITVRQVAIQLLEAAAEAESKDK